MWLHLVTVVLYAMLATYVVVLVGIPFIILSTVLSGRASRIAAQLEDQTDKELFDTVVAKGVQGHMIGKVSPQGGMFWGVPFSQPPTGEFRWKKLRQPVSFPRGVWNATYHRPGCPQICDYRSKNFTCPDETDEDCLYLNIWVPKTVLSSAEGDNVVNKSHYVISEKHQAGDENALAVMVYIHGGSYVFGSGSALIYDSRFLAEQGDVIVVTINYRLGALGFLVQGDGPDAVMGNFGIWDQIFALQWVQKNIKFFGGNPQKVTIFGQSSGAESVGVLMTSSKAAGLFHGAIMFSNPLSLPLRDVKGAKEFGAQFANKLHCMPGDMSCLRNAGVEDILRAAKVQTLSFFSTGKKLFAVQPWGPVIDNDFLQELPLHAFKNGRAAQAPFIMGATTDEGMFFVSLAITYELSTIFYNFAINSLLQDKATLVLAKYPTNCQSVCDNRYVVSDIVTDYVFICPARKALMAEKQRNPNSWLYIFDQTLPFPDLWESDMCNDKVCHSADLPFIFDNDKLAHLKFSDDDKMLARRIGFYWTNFAKYGDPNGNGEFLNNSESREKKTQGDYKSAYWPKFSDSSYGSYSAIKFKSSGDTVQSDPYQDICDFWDELNSYGAFR